MAESQTKLLFGCRLDCKCFAECFGSKKREKKVDVIEGVEY